MFKMGPQSGITSGSVRGESVFLPFPVFSGHLQTLTCGPFLCLQSQWQQTESSSCLPVSVIASLESLSHF